MSHTSMNDTHKRIADSLDAQGLMATIGARLVLVSDGEVHIALPFSRRVTQQHGYVHAGAIASIIDSACGYAALTKAPPGYEVVTAEFKINLLRPAVGDHFLAVARVQNAGRLLTICTGEVRAFSGAEPAHKVVALVQATIVNVRNDARPPAAGDAPQTVPP
ncbi:MAG: PaaI family thioesterase [Steroidobacteraceae bacterium]